VSCEKGLVGGFGSRDGRPGRLWYYWQLAHPGADSDADLLDITTLGYGYSAVVSTATP
jgi:hypothetical protein